VRQPCWPKTFCREFNSEHTYNFSRWWRHYCDVIWQ